MMRARSQLGVIAAIVVLVVVYAFEGQPRADHSEVSDSQPSESARWTCPSDSSEVRGQGSTSTYVACVKTDTDGNRVRHGPYTRWYLPRSSDDRACRKLEEGLFREGQKEGIWVYWGPDGARSKVEEFGSGKVDRRIVYAHD